MKNNYAYLWKGMKYKMKEQKASLLNEFEKMNPFTSKDKKQEKILDERIVNENNKVISSMYFILLFLLVLTNIFSNIINVTITLKCINILIAITSYIGLLILCKNKAIEGNNNIWMFIIWGIIYLPVSIYIPFSDFIYTNIENKIFVLLIVLGTIIGLPILLYQIANIVYKKNM